MNLKEPPSGITGSWVIANLVGISTGFSYIG